MATWQVQHAKTRLSELIEDANTKGPQIISRHGDERAVVLSMREYRSLCAGKPSMPKPNFIEFLLSQPLLAEDDEFFEIMDQIQAERALHTGRQIDLDD